MRHCKNTRYSAALAFDTGGHRIHKGGSWEASVEPGHTLTNRHNKVEVFFFFFLQFAFARANKALAAAKESHKAVS